MTVPMDRELIMDKGPVHNVQRIRDRAHTHQRVGTAAEQIRPIARDTLLVKIVNTIAQLMMRGVWRPGDMIPSENELAQRFGVGRSTIREALKSFVVLGVIEARAGEGSFVREPTSDILSGAFRWGLLLGERNIGDLVDVRLLLETDCARRAARAPTAEDVARLREINGRMADSDIGQVAFMARDNEFHNEIARIAGNVLLQNISSTIQAMVGIWYPSTYYQQEIKSLTMAEHAAVTDAIAAADPNGAAEAMHKHISLAAERLRRVMEKPDGEARVFTAVL